MCDATLVKACRGRSKFFLSSITSRNHYSAMVTLQHLSVLQWGDHHEGVSQLQQVSTKKLQCRLLWSNNMSSNSEYCNRFPGLDQWGKNCDWERVLLAARCGRNIGFIYEVKQSSPGITPGDSTVRVVRSTTKLHMQKFANLLQRYRKSTERQVKNSSPELTHCGNEWDPKTRHGYSVECDDFSTEAEYHKEGSKGISSAARGHKAEFQVALQRCGRIL